MCSTLIHVLHYFARFGAADLFASIVVEEWPVAGIRRAAAGFKFRNGFLAIALSFVVDWIPNFGAF